jgi:hypothetical protein
MMMKISILTKENPVKQSISTKGNPMKKLILSLLLVSSLFVACGNDTPASTQTTTTESETLEVNIQFANVGGGIAPNSNILLSFIKDLDGATVSNATVLLTDDLNKTLTPSLTVNLTVNSNNLTISPSVILNNNTNYIITLTTGLALLDGNVSTPIDKEYTYEFQTGDIADIDNINPVPISQSPGLGATDISIYSAISLSFSEDIDPSFPASVTIDSVPAANVTQGKRSLLIKPDSKLDYGATHTVVVSGLQDYAGNPFDANNSWSFTVQGEPTQSGTVYNASTLAIGAAVRHSLVVLRDDINISSTRISRESNGSLYTDEIFKFVPGTPTALAGYDDRLFIASGANIVQLPTGDENISVDTNISMDFNISYMSMNNDRACLINKDTQSLNMMSIYEQSGYFKLPAPSNYFTDSGAQYKKCKVDKAVVYAATQSVGVQIFNMVTDNSAPISSGSVGTGVVEDLAISGDYMVYTQGTQIEVADVSASAFFVGSMELNVTIGSVAIFENFVFASEQNGTNIFVIDIKVPSSPELFHTIVSSDPVAGIVLAESDLYVLHEANASITEEYYDISSIILAEYTDIAVSGTPYSVNSFKGYNFISNGTGVEVRTAKGDLAFSTPATPGTALTSSAYTQVDTNLSYVVVADHASGVSFYNLDFDTNSSTGPVDTMSGLGDVFDVSALSYYDLNGTAHTKLFVASSSQGLLGYDITTITSPILELNNSSVITAFSIDSVYSPATNLAYFSVADYTGQRILGYNFSDLNTPSQEFNISVSSHPRSVTIDKESYHTFAALGSAGIVAISGDTNHTFFELATPGFAMQVDSNVDSNSTYGDLFVADYTGMTLINFDTNAGVLSSIFLRSFIPQDIGTVYGVATNFTEYDGSVISVDNVGASARIFTMPSEPQSDTVLDPNDPVDLILFETNENATEGNVNVVFDPFI